jgi:hypothetical protein
MLRPFVVAGVRIAILPDGAVPSAGCVRVSFSRIDRVIL